MAPKRVRTFAAAVCRSGVAAGTMDSRKGSAIVTPAPVRKVRRERCFFVMNSILRLLQRGLKPATTFLRFDFLLERVALNDSKHQRGKLVVVLSSPPDNRPDRGHVVVLHRTARSISQKLLRK